MADDALVPAERSDAPLIHRLATEAAAALRDLGPRPVRWGLEEYEAVDRLRRACGGRLPEPAHQAWLDYRREPMHHRLVQLIEAIERLLPAEQRLGFDPQPADEELEHEELDVDDVE